MREYTESDKKYAEFMIETATKGDGFVEKIPEPGWHEFAGKVLLAGVQLGWDMDDVLEYLFESYHGLDLKVCNVSYEEVKKDMFTSKCDVLVPE